MDDPELLAAELPGPRGAGRAGGEVTKEFANVTKPSEPQVQGARGPSAQVWVQVQVCARPSRHAESEPLTSRDAEAKLRAANRGRCVTDTGPGCRQTLSVDAGSRVFMIRREKTVNLESYIQQNPWRKRRQSKGSAGAGKPQGRPVPVVTTPSAQRPRSDRAPRAAVWRARRRDPGRGEAGTASLRG